MYTFARGNERAGEGNAPVQFRDIFGQAVYFLQLDMMTGPFCTLLRTRSHSKTGIKYGQWNVRVAGCQVLLSLP